ncbi:hypothetical protein [Bythopirellula polymerisocia]|uniref:OstA-like protein n=1 Tax=Bythopirellula polymerisocia TaxID=2528003 RepID=A0A5C6CXK4_9BACT|nr:hypothetical protein [Bythopirellula polymerisocia]TWU29683.1 hypothetical protein Pla144_04620 [Bythopirellula polymerisocia]
MFTRLTHAAVAFAITVVVYQVYVLLAVPLLEPNRRANLIDLAELDLAAKPRVATHKHREMLAAYFPADHWTLQKPPKSFDNGQAMILVDDYQPHESGQVRVQKCALLFFPHERVMGETPPRDAVILEAPHGAILQLDEGFLAGFKGVGRMQWAKLLGEITVRSDMREQGPQDDLLLKTRDLYVNQDLIRTDAEVEMRLGPHWGRGKILEIRLVAIERGRTSAAGPDIGGIDSLEIRQDVAAELSIGETTLLGNNDSSQETPPVEVRSQGRFKFDFSTNVASFIDQVRLKQVYSNGARNRLLCEELNLYMATDQQSVLDEESSYPTTSVAGRARTLSQLLPGTVEAHGTDLKPVELTVETHAASARCGLLRLELGPQRVTFSSQDEIELKYKGNEIHAPLVQYQAPPKASGYQIGTLLAAGNGWLKSAANSSQRVELRWTDGINMRHIQGKPVLTVRGRPRLTTSAGRLWADELEMVLRERAVDGSEEDLLPADIAPERMTARGHVDIDSTQLSGKINRLKIDVQYLPIDLSLGNASGGAPASALLGGGTNASARAYRIDGDTLDIGVIVRDAQPQISSLDVRGELEFREEAANGAGAQPLIVRGKELQIRNAETSAAKISLRGQPATITAAGMAIEAVELQVNRGTSAAKINAPGQLVLPIERDLQGQLLAQPEPLEVTWQGGMNLENDRVIFHGNVVARTSSGQLNTERLVVVLSASIQFDGTTQASQTQLTQLECWEGVSAQFIQRDAVGITSIHKMKLKSLRANQVTGLVDGNGPGVIESVHLSTSAMPGAPAAPFADVTPSTNFSAVGASRIPQNLRFLRVDFLRGVQGNLNEDRVAVEGDVKAVYGPVDSWEQTLPTQLQGSPAPDTVYIECQSLQVAQSPAARLQRDPRTGSVELLAEGHVIIEGLAGNQGTFTANAHIAKYDQQKSKFLLQGDGVRPATLTGQKSPGAQLNEQTFNSLEYNQSTDEWKATGVGRGQLNGFPGK